MRVHQVRLAFDVHGPAAAREVADKLGVSPRLIRRWLRKWEDDIFVPERGQRVYAKYWPERTGTIVATGSVVSEVKWDNGFTADRYLCNRHLQVSDKPEKANKSERRRERARLRRRLRRI